MRVWAIFAFVAETEISDGANDCAITQQALPIRTAWLNRVIGLLIIAVVALDYQHLLLRCGVVDIVEHVIIGHDYFFNGIYCSPQIFVGSNERVAPCVHMINETFAQAGIYRCVLTALIAIESCARQLSGCGD